MVLKLLTTFMAGFLTCAIILFLLAYTGTEFPTGLSIADLEASSPGDKIEEEQIHIYKDYIIIQLPNASLARYAPTGSMKPLLDEGSNGIRIKPKSPKDIDIGDLVSFKRNGKNIIHRVINKGIDEEGIYYQTKGDNLNYPDKTIRFEDIEYLTVGILW
jgi:hypothetical protein